MTERLDALIDSARQPVDGRSLAFFRIVFGAILTIAMARYIANGWVDIHYVEPSFFFKYTGLEWVAVPGRTTLYAMAYGLCVCALLITVGLFTRPALVVFTLGFGYWEAMDVTNYLNHYILVLLLCVELLLTPCHRVWSLDNLLLNVDNRPFRRPQTPTIPAWCLWMLRIQIAVVYFSAAIAKVGSDWLIDGQPMGIWLASRGHLPVIGWLQGFAATPLVFSWAGFLYDLTIPFLLLWRPTRQLAFCAVVVFHGMTHVLFDIGIFPFIMTAASTLFFAPNWLSRGRSQVVQTVARGDRKYWMRPVMVAALTLVLLQLVWPQRHLIYGGNVLWHEQGMRFSWRVMVREKHGSITYRVVDRASGREWQVPPSRYLNMRQEAEFSGQPDLIRQLARHIHSDFKVRGFDVAVRVDAPVSLNGRAPSLLIDDQIDLAQPVDDKWILPAPNSRARSSRTGRL
ncbi:MAG: HTTM domain-containing protein [Myxococcota bacterium]|nr:HTTM domain-containing protein [Myxococcota bacterium]